MLSLHAGRFKFRSDLSWVRLWLRSDFRFWSVLSHHLLEKKHKQWFFEFFEVFVPLKLDATSIHSQKALSKCKTRHPASNGIISNFTVFYASCSNFVTFTQFKTFQFFSEPKILVKNAFLRKINITFYPRSTANLPKADWKKCCTISVKSPSLQNCAMGKLMLKETRGDWLIFSTINNERKMMKSYSCSILLFVFQKMHIFRRNL